MQRYIFTVTAGRSGQNTLASLIESHVYNCYSAFEQPQINYISSGALSAIERAFRRKFIETHELLGRGKILTSFVDGDIEYIESISRKKVNIINKKMKESNSKIYFDISKYFARGLHIGFQKILPKFSLVHLVRDPILNMRSFLNRNKDFYLDNNSPGSNHNMLIMDPYKMESGELYLWAWCEMALRYEDMKKMTCVDKYTEVHTKKLNDSDYINQIFDNLELSHHLVKKNCVRLNTNIESGYKKTEVTKNDIEKFEKFVNKVPNLILDKIPYLDLYDPYLTHQI